MSPNPDYTQSVKIQKQDSKGFSLLVLPIILFSIMCMTFSKGPFLYLIGQVAGGLFFAQAFILLHETGHRSLFKTKTYNNVFGHIFSFFVFIPYYNWLEIHDLHHKWTGWRDKDPTTEKTFADRFNPKQEKIVNFCWKYYIPLFTLGYRFGIYWKAEKLKRHLPAANYKRCLKEMYFYAGLYLVSILFFPNIWLKLIPALYLSFMITDILSLSQHSHIEMPVSNGQEVNPLKYQEQPQYSRSLELPPIISKYILFNFNYHEVHHAFPGLPCYFLDQVKVNSSNSFKFWPWLKKVKAMKGVDFVFRTDPNKVI